MKNISPPYFLIFTFFLSLLGLEKNIAQTLCINEFMASNATAIADPDYQAYSDWIELYNASDIPINLKGYGITDDLAMPTKYIFQTDLIIQPKNYLLVWADSKTLAHIPISN